MGNANTSVRSQLKTGVTVASACLLALGLIAAPPSSRGARIEAHAVQLTSSALPPSAYLGALEKFISNRVPAAVLNTSAVQGGAFDIATVVGPTTDPTTDGELVRTAALATPSALGPAALPSPLALLGPLINNSIVGPFVLVGAIALGFVVGIFFLVPFEWLKAVLGGILSLPAALPLPGTVAALAEVSSTAATTLSSNAEVDRVSAATATADSEDTASVVKTAKADLSPKERSTGIEQMSTDTMTSAKDVPETVEVENVSGETTEAKVNTPETTKPAKRPETPRPAARDSLDASKQQDDRPHGKVDRSTGKTAAAAEKSGSSSAASQSDDSSPKDGGPSGGDAGDSE